MRIKLNSDSLKSGLNKILTVVDKKNSRPILTYTLISTNTDSIELCATDLEVSAKVKVDAVVDNSGNFCVNAKNLFDILKELPNSEIELILDTSENVLKLNCNDIHYSLLIYPSDEYPKLIFGNESSRFNLLSDQLIEIINKTSYAISDDETRLQLNGIYLHEVEYKLRAVATDGLRLSLVETDLEQGNIDTLINGIIIPKKGVFEIKKLAENYPDKKITISVDESFMYINANNEYYLSIRLIAREYPKYQAIIPSKTTYSITVEKQNLLDAIRRIKIMANEKSNGVRILIQEKEMTITANHPSLGDAQETIPVEFNGKEMEVGFNARFLIDTLQTIDEGEISIELNNELTPVIIKSNNSPNYLGIIMPLKI
ncbi:DNA polymerase III, beta subunit [Bacteriovorax sp. BSW11_IV]|uniref:DNA polymerase III subunit beta n=1 Tax=Bacteriovorax sp. BSW11_IV TaxID=1353529 RepID=UPI00038A214C|nr:DNA polymerase III subunit beta [Bacteriovorax sp. BSW11_IV]EQC50010.1 DNA polymerase III, beta subunit [Bacteriovorax sp. BSW11_IV]